MLTLPKHEIVDCGAFYEGTFFCILPENLLGDFFYSLNAAGHREPCLLGEVLDPMEPLVRRISKSREYPLIAPLSEILDHRLRSSPYVQWQKREQNNLHRRCYTGLYIPQPGKLSPWELPKW
jgi:hypothetical protein